MDTTKLPKKLILIGNSGSGKTTIKNMLLHDAKYCHYNFIGDISHTTRPKRNSEIDGKDYYFVSDEEFNNSGFVQKVEHNGYKYGTSIEQFINNNLFIMNPTGINIIPHHFFNEFNIKIVRLMISKQLSQSRQLDRCVDNESKALAFSKAVIRYRFEKEEFSKDIIHPYLNIFNENLSVEKTIKMILNYYEGNSNN
jgi:GTPase SAR1 family protein